MSKVAVLIIASLLIITVSSEAFRKQFPKKKLLKGTIWDSVKEEFDGAFGFFHNAIAELEEMVTEPFYFIDNKEATLPTMEYAAYFGYPIEVTNKYKKIIKLKNKIQILESHYCD